MKLPAPGSAHIALRDLFEVLVRSLFGCHFAEPPSPVCQTYQAAQQLCDARKLASQELRFFWRGYSSRCAR